VIVCRGHYAATLRGQNVIIFIFERANDDRFELIIKPLLL